MSRPDGGAPIQSRAWRHGVQKGVLRACSFIAAISLVPPPAPAQSPPPSAPAAAETSATSEFNPEQLDALLAPVALYPDDLLVQVLMASAFPIEIVEASRWREKDDNKALSGEALAKALESQPWDPSIKSLMPFPQVMAQMNENLSWTQQLGYAFAQQQNDVMDSVQRLRAQAQTAGALKTTEQQVVKTEAVVDDAGAPTPQQIITIQPANPQVIYVPSYNPTVVYGAWPYPATPPVYLPPPPGYAVGTALLSGMAFAAGVAVVGSLWGWASPHWGWGGNNNVNVNVNRYNRMAVNNVNRANVSGGQWRPPAAGVGGRPTRPPAGPVGTPRRANGLPANAIGRPAVKVPSSAVNRPNIGAAAPVSRPGAGGAGRPTATPQRQAAAPKRPAAAPKVAANRPATAFSGFNDGARAGQYQARGAQSRAIQQQPRGGAARGQRPAGGARQR